MSVRLNRNFRVARHPDEFEKYVPDGHNESGRGQDVHKKKTRKPLKERISALISTLREKAQRQQKDDASLDGDTSVLDILAPSSVNTKNYNYIIVDGVCHAYLYIAAYTSKVGMGWLNPLVEAGEGVNLNFILARQPREKILPKVSQTVMINRSRMREVDDMRSDYEELDSAISSGVYIKDGMNRASMDFYYMHTLIEIVADDPETLEQRAAYMETLCASMDMLCKRANYAQEQAFLSTLPLLRLDPDIARKSRRNILTDTAAAAFPFSSFEICDKHGIVLGINQHNRSVAIVDIFDAAQYSNANAAIMGMSGAGKTFLLQLIALRLRMQDTQVFIIAPLKGHEFRPACEAIGGKYIKLSPSSRDCINIMEIRKTSLDTDHEIGELDDRDDSVLAGKIQELHIFYSLLKPDITQDERHYLDVALVETYARFGVNHENASLYLADGATFKPMPILKDLFDTLREKDETKHLALALNRFVSGSAHRLGQRTNVNLNNKYIVLDISELGKDLLPLGMFIALNFTWDKAKESRIQKKVIMLDELWHLIGASSNKDAADYVLEIFKVIRGYGGSAIGATQDVNDFFALNDGSYGKGIINNARFKIVLQMEEDEARRIQKVLGLSDEETMQIIRNQRGQGLLCANRNRLSIEFRASQREFDLISSSRADLLRKAQKFQEQ